MPDKTFKELVKHYFKLYEVYLNEHEKAMTPYMFYIVEFPIKPLLSFDEWMDVCEKSNDELIHIK